MTHISIATTRGLNRDMPLLQLCEKAKRLGFWNPLEDEINCFARETEAA